MTTLVLQLTPTMAKRVARAADIISAPTHEDVALKALGLFLDSVVGKARGRKRRQSPWSLSVKHARDGGARMK